MYLTDLNSKLTPSVCEWSRLSCFRLFYLILAADCALLLPSYYPTSSAQLLTNWFQRSNPASTSHTLTIILAPSKCFHASPSLAQSISSCTIISVQALIGTTLSSFASLQTSCQPAHVAAKPIIHLDEVCLQKLLAIDWNFRATRKHSMCSKGGK